MLSSPLRFAWPALLFCPLIEAVSTTRSFSYSNTSTTASTTSSESTSGSSSDGFSRKSTSSSSSSYVFNANATDNVAVYYGSTNATSTTNLTALCDDSNIDIVVLTFIREVNGAGDYPYVDFTTLGCTGQTSEMEASGATGLVWCPDLASEITQCQSGGKKVFVSIGGANGNTTFANETAAQQGAELIWDIFGSGTGSNISYRPFGDAVVDGFDIDNETGDGSFWSTFVSSLRTLFGTHTDHTFYLSAAPQCYYPSPSAPLDMLTQMDFVWPQFYDSKTCGLGTDGFNASVSAWSTRLTAGAGPSLMIGSLSFQDGGAGGYVDPDSYESVIKGVEDMKLSNLGGVTLWDGAFALEDKNDDGTDYVDMAKEALRS